MRLVTDTPKGARSCVVPAPEGFETAGVVTEVGPGVDGFKAGDHVAAITLAGGGYATHVVIPAATAIPLPPELDPLSELPFLCRD